MVLVIENLNFGTITTQIHFEWTSRIRQRTFKTHLETGRQRHQLHRKMECRSLCFNIKMWIKNVSLLTAWNVSKYGVFSDLYFLAFGLNTKRYFVSPRIQSENGKIRTRKNSVFGHFSCSVRKMIFVKRNSRNAIITCWIELNRTRTIFPMIPEVSYFE